MFTEISFTNCVDVNHNFDPSFSLRASSAKITDRRGKRTVHFDLTESQSKVISRVLGRPNATIIWRNAAKQLTDPSADPKLSSSWEYVESTPWRTFPSSTTVEFYFNGKPVEPTEETFDFGGEEVTF